MKPNFRFKRKKKKLKGNVDEVTLKIYGRPSRWQKSKTQRSPSSPQIHQKYIYMRNNSYRTPTERWQKTSDFPKARNPPRTWVGQKKKEKTETKE